MRKVILHLLVFIFSGFGLSAQDWELLDIGIDDNFNSLVFLYDDGLIAGDKGIYVTTTGGETPEDWTRFEISGSQSVAFNGTKWNDCYRRFNSLNEVYVCGRDTINNKPVFIKIELPSLEYTFLYYGFNEVGGLNGVSFNPWNDLYYAVGDNGLIVSSNGSGNSLEPIENLDQDLLSIDFSSNDYIIGATDHFVRGEYNDNGFNAQIDNTPGQEYRSAIIGGIYSHAVGNEIYTSQYLNVPVQTEYYNYGDLEGNTISVRGLSNKFYVGTSHGIFAGLHINTPSPILEWQPSSGTYSINGIWQTGQESYACGDNGIFLRTEEIDEVEKYPFCAIVPPEGACLDTSFEIEFLTKGSGTSCQWFMGDELVGSSCSDLVVPTDVVGTFEVSFVSSNSVGSDTATTSYTVVDPPLSDISFSISDSILCHQESIEVLLDISEPTSSYLLQELSSGDVWGESMAGSGGPLSFQSMPISETSQFQLVASHTEAECTALFDEVISIEVEQTAADFHFDLINASTEEQVFFYQRAEDADNFEWTFSEGSSVTESGLSEVGATFGELGTTWVELVCWSENNCYDSIAKPGPTIFTSPGDPDSCWINVNYDVDPPWQGFYVPDVADVALVKDGVLTCGTYSDITFPSRFGSDYSMEGRGGFLAKTDTNGVLKWVMHSENETDPGRFAYTTAAVEDNEGNIYVGGVAIETEESFQRYIRDNADNRIRSQWPSYLLKLDSRGKLIWSYSIADLRIDGLSVDPSNNLYLNLSYAFLDTENGMMIFNETDTVFTSAMNGIATDKAMKMSPEGEVLWEVEMENDNTNGGEIKRINFDENGNVYVAGNFEYDLTLYSTAGVEEAVIDNQFGNPQAGRKGFILKYDSLGNYNWGVSCKTITEFSVSYGEFADMTTDEDGNTYVTGKNNCWTLPPEQEVFVFYNSDGTTTEAILGHYFVAKVNPDGICEWIEGHTNSATGSSGTCIAVGDGLLTVIGNGTNDQGNFQSHFTSSDGATLILPMTASAYFVAEYTTDGVLNKLCLSDIDPTTMYSFGNENMVIGPEGEIYHTRNQSILGIENEVYEQFGTTISNSGGLSNVLGVLLRFTPDCGYCFTPEPGDVQDVNQYYNETIRYYPNPTGGQVFFELDNDGEWEEYRVFDISGQLIRAGNLSDSRRLEIDLPQPAGVYLIRLLGNSDAVLAVPVVKY